MKRLAAEISAYLAERNAHPKPFSWEADRKENLSKIQRARQELDEQRAQRRLNAKPIDRQAQSRHSNPGGV